MNAVLRQAPRRTVWLVDDDRSIRFVLEKALTGAGFAVESYDAAEPALRALAARTPDLVFTDVRMPGMDGLSFLEKLGQQVQVPVVVMSAYTDLSSTVAAFHRGAFDYLPKPFDIDAAIDMAQRATARELPAAETDWSDEGLIGDTPAMREVFRAIGRLSRADLSVLITGETGTGKELIARALHRHSSRAEGPFIALNTAAIAPELLESELFGHEQGAFTGATRRHPGRFEQAERGTLFLDEIGDMPLALQTRLLRVLAEGEFYRVGGRELIRADVRVIAATHQDLRGKVERGEFRADLLHRLDVVRIHLPALRERAADVPRLAERFLVESAREMRVASKQLSMDAVRALSRYPWPGNVRELRNLCQRLALMAPGPQVLLADLPEEVRRADPASPVNEIGWTRSLAEWARRQLESGAPDLLETAKEALEQVLFDEALRQTGGDRQQAARRLGCGRNTLTRKLGPKRR
jgi:two-component system, NtrC family, nitrogen regulation response regulator GlnG